MLAKEEEKKTTGGLDLIMSRDVGDGSWCTIESDPGVFTELISRIGVKEVLVEELWELSAEQLERLAPVYGLIFLFKWRSERDARPIAQNCDDLFFASQVINNACATQAILSVLLNSPATVEIGEELRAFREFTRDFPPDSKGLAISNSDLIRAVHNSFAPAEPFVSDMKVATDDDDVFHFISYVPFRGKVYELDGLKPGPIELANYQVENPSSWFEAIIPQIQERIQRYSTEEIHFNLLAVAKDPAADLAARLAVIQATLNEISTRLGESGDVVMSEAPPAPPEEIPADSHADELRSRAEALQAEASEARERIQSIAEKAQQRQVENARRRHNYLPLLVEMLKLLGEKGMLGDLVQKARKMEH